MERSVRWHRWNWSRGGSVLEVIIRCELGSRKEQSIQSTGLGIIGTVRVRIEYKKSKQIGRKCGAVQSVSAEEAGGNPYAAAIGVENEDGDVKITRINRRAMLCWQRRKLTTNLTSP